MTFDLFSHILTTAQGFEGILSAYGTLRGSLFNMDKLTTWLMEVIPAKCMQDFQNEIIRREKLELETKDESSESDLEEDPTKGFLSRIAEGKEEIMNIGNKKNKAFKAKA